MLILACFCSNSKYLFVTVLYYSLFTGCCVMIHLTTAGNINGSVSLDTLVTVAQIVWLLWKLISIVTSPNQQYMLHVSYSPEYSFSNTWFVTWDPDVEVAICRAMSHDTLTHGCTYLLSYFTPYFALQCYRLDLGWTNTCYSLLQWNQQSNIRSLK